MKTITAILIYTAITHMPFDVVLGITAGLLFGMLCVMVFVGPTPSPRHAPAKATVRKQTQRRIINSTAKQPAYVFVPTNYEWSAA
jgi:hypothetical protein